MQQLPLVEPHPFKATLRKLRISQSTAAHFLGTSQSSLSQFLLGYRAFPPELEEKLGKLIEQAKQGEQECQGC